MACINTDSKELLLQEIDNLLPDSSRKVKLANFINQLPKCTVEEISKGKKNQRPLSKYNIHMGQCMKGTGRSMADCIKDWKKIKEEMKTS